jgi:hypothetical protein
MAQRASFKKKNMSKLHPASTDMFYRNLSREWSLIYTFFDDKFERQMIKTYMRQTKITFSL